MVGNAVVLAASYAKEKYVDPVVSHDDVAYGLIGSAFSSLVFGLLPKDAYEYESEGGAFNLTPRGSSNLPPSTPMVKAQSTIWFNGIIGFHQFSGGYDNGKKDDSGKRLFYGAGFRFPLFPIVKSKKKPPISTWFGVSYGRLLFATEEQSVSFKKYEDTLFYSVGMRFHFTDMIQLNTEFQHINYDKERVISVGSSLGLNF